MIFIESGSDVDFDENEKYHILYLKDVTDNEAYMLENVLGYEYMSVSDDVEMYVKTEVIEE